MIKFFRARPFLLLLFASFLLICGAEAARIVTGVSVRPALTTTVATVTTPALSLHPIGQVVWVKGDVEASQAGKNRSLQRRSVIYEHDMIVTGPDASGEVVFTDSSIVTLRGGTQLKIDKYHFDPATPADNKYIAGLAKGGFRTITGLISHGHPENYQVNTPVATIGVRGTIYTLAIAGGTLSIEINQGAIVATNQAGQTVMIKGKTLPFSEISGLNVPATQTAQQPAALQGQPETTPAPAPSAQALQTQATQQQQQQQQTTTTTGGAASTTGGGGGTSGGGGDTSGGTSSGGSTSSGTSDSSTTGGSSSTSSGGTSSTDSTGGSSTTAAPAASPTGNSNNFCIGG